MIAFSKRSCVQLDFLLISRVDILFLGLYRFLCFFFFSLSLKISLLKSSWDILVKCKVFRHFFSSSLQFDPLIIFSLNWMKKYVFFI